MVNASVHTLRSQAARAVLAVLVLLATQVALADGLCHAVMLGGGYAMKAGAVAEEHDAMSSPCCDDMSRRVDCRFSPMDATTMATPPLAKSSLLPAAVPLPAYVPAASISADDRAPRAPPDARAAPPLPVYLRFGRFLS
jgi:hypothetical protein